MFFGVGMTFEGQMRKLSDTFHLKLVQGGGENGHPGKSHGTPPTGKMYVAPIACITIIRSIRCYVSVNLSMLNGSRQKKKSFR